ncbi:MAG: hypothetical protein B0D92_05640 [Spirochaeta sp. LUC14_002_19_P3]|nr:MAG: hypothetical protein B0D92_05640 [Spirochaeta sp. LUC14_002_19_P3]
MHGPLSSEEQDLLALLPIISRARGSRLYTPNGSRWLDLYADNGRALMGHRPGGISLRLKNELDRGLYAPYPNPWPPRLAKALHHLFPGYQSARIYRSLERALQSTGSPTPPTDPLDLPPSTEKIPGSAWGRPLLPRLPQSDYLFPILPLPGFDEVQCVLYAREHTALPPSDPISPLILAALTRACTTLVNPKLQARGTAPPPWEMRGPYMLYRGTPAEYPSLFETMFKRRILIAPSFQRPSIYPLEISPGEAALMN